MKGLAGLCYNAARWRPKAPIGAFAMPSTLRASLSASDLFLN